MNKTLIAGIAAILAVAAFSGMILPANAEPVGADMNGTGPKSYYSNIVGTAGINICSGPGETTSTAVPYGNSTLYEAAESPWDWSKTPEEYGGYVAATQNGMASDAEYYVNIDAGSKMTDHFELVYYNVVEVSPAAWGGHHPTATKNYTAYSSAVWDLAGSNYWWVNLRAFDTLAVSQSGADAVLTWTVLPQVNNTLTGYDIYQKTGAGSWTKVAANIPAGTGTTTITGGWIAGSARYVMSPVFQENFHIYGRSNIVWCVSGNVAPTANAGPDQSVASGTLVTFNGAGSSDSDGTIASYSWTFTDGVLRTLTGVGPTYTFNTAGVYTVTLTVTDDDGATGTDTMTVTVSAANVAPTANAAPDQSVNEDVLVTFNGAGSSDSDGSIVSYSWTFTDGTPKTLTGVSPTYTFATPGVYTVTLTVTDDDGATGTDTMTVTVADKTAIVVTDTSPAGIAPGTAFAISCTGTDFQTLVLGSITLYWEDVLGVQAGPVVASTFTSVVDNQMTKADDGETPMDTHSWTWNIPAQTEGEVHYWFATNDGAGNTATVPAAAAWAGPYNVITIAAAGNQPHPLVGYVVDPLGAGLNLATVTAEWNNMTMTVVTANDGAGNPGWFQIDIPTWSWNVGDTLWVNATYVVGTETFTGFNMTLFAVGDNILPDDDKEYLNVTIIMADYFELKWTLGWNIWSIPMLWNASLGLNALDFSWFGAAHWMDTSKVGAGDNAVLSSYVAGAYVTYVYPLDNGTAADLMVTQDIAYWAYVQESWFTDETPATEVGIFVPGQYVWRVFATRAVTVNAGWNLLGWTSFNANFTATDVIWTLTSAASSADGVPQPEIIANWTSDDWEAGNTADMQHWEGLKGYTTFVSLGVYGQSTIVHDFPVGPGYGFWVYSEVGGQTLTYLTQ